MSYGTDVTPNQACFKYRYMAFLDEDRYMAFLNEDRYMAFLNEDRYMVALHQGGA
jgi:hypothetical protein